MNFLDMNLAYRGVSKTGQYAYGKKEVRVDRIPRDTPIKVHEIFNNIFEEIFGYRLRQESLFASRSYHMTETYATMGNGIVGVIYPIGEYHIVASKKIKDLLALSRTRVLKLFPKEFNKDALRKRFQHITSDISLDKHIDWVQYATIEDVLKYPNNSVKDMTARMVMKTINVYLQDVLKKYIYKNYDFESDTTIDDTELMIICDSYYFFDYKMLEANKDFRDIYKLSPAKALLDIERNLRNGSLSL